MTYFFIGIIIIGILLFLVDSKLPYLVGKRGELFVAWRLRKLNPKKYKVLNNLILPSSGNTAATQIDHVIVSNYGIFCIETKTYKGWIFGDAQQEHWVEVIYRYKKSFYNPVRQNYAHLKAVEALIKPKFPNALYFGFVIFLTAGKLKISGTENVGYSRHVISKITSITTEVLTDDEVNHVVKTLLTNNITDKNARRKHNEEIQLLNS